MEKYYAESRKKIDSEAVTMWADLQIEKLKEIAERTFERRREDAKKRYAEDPKKLEKELKAIEESKKVRYKEIEEIFEPYTSLGEEISKLEKIKKEEAPLEKAERLVKELQRKFNLISRTIESKEHQKIEEFFETYEGMKLFRGIEGIEGIEGILDAEEISDIVKKITDEGSRPISKKIDNRIDKIRKNGKHDFIHILKGKNGEFTIADSKEREDMTEISIEELIKIAYQNANGIRYEDNIEESEFDVEESEFVKEGKNELSQYKRLYHPGDNEEQIAAELLKEKLERLKEESPEDYEIYAKITKQRTEIIRELPKYYNEVAVLERVLEYMHKAKAVAAESTVEGKEKVVQALDKKIVQINGLIDKIGEKIEEDRKLCGMDSEMARQFIEFANMAKTHRNQRDQDGYIKYSQEAERVFQDDLCRAKEAFRARETHNKGKNNPDKIASGSEEIENVNEAVAEEKPKGFIKNIIEKFKNIFKRKPNELPEGQTAGPTAGSTKGPESFIAKADVNVVAAKKAAEEAAKTAAEEAAKTAADDGYGEI